MSARSRLQRELLEKLGSPLVSAALDIQYRQRDEDAGVDLAEQVAALLGKSVEAGLELSREIDDKKDADSDAVRLGLTTVGAALVANIARNAAKPPGEEDLKKLVAACRAVLTFSDNFTASPENLARVQGADPAALPEDESQRSIQYLHAFLPVISVVSAFSFGQNAQKMAQDVGQRLIEDAEALSRSLGNAKGAPSEQKPSSLACLATLSILYAQSHQTEMMQVLSLTEEERMRAVQENNGSLPVAPIWESYEKQMSMLRTLAAPLLGIDMNTTASEPEAKSEAVDQGPPPPETASPATVETKTPEEPAPPETQEASETPQEDAKTSKEAPENPMSFFKKKKTDDGEQ